MKKKKGKIISYILQSKKILREEGNEKAKGNNERERSKEQNQLFYSE